MRYGVPEDVHNFMDLCLLCTQENGLAEMNVTKVLSEVWASLHHDRGIIGVIGDPGKIEGGVMLRIDSLPYSDSPVLAERAIFVHPDYRWSKGSGVGGGRAMRLCEFAKNCANSLDLPLLIGVLSNHRTAAKIKFYERVFGQPSGAYWLVNSKTGLKHEAAE